MTPKLDRNAVLADGSDVPRLPRISATAEGGATAMSTSCQAGYKTHGGSQWWKQRAKKMAPETQSAQPDNGGPLMRLFAKVISNFKDILSARKYGGELIYSIDISVNKNRRSCIYIIKGGDENYYGMIRLHVNEASFLYKISIDELKLLAIDIPKALDAVKTEKSRTLAQGQ
ncbi:hypothetical protein [Rhizobium sp. WYCCWR 11146]|uniref:hypothetical protein n=1 Tax=Rhizobium sp. WYCCWR 11146 TaxID=2749833 RepID=UPI001FEF45B8|nr:hypothetical protein [Rhizobium sp. WYCCWR 11146]